jgi:hypothetical protein
MSLIPTKSCSVLVASVVLLFVGAAKQSPDEQQREIFKKMFSMDTNFGDYDDDAPAGSGHGPGEAETLRNMTDVVVRVDRRGKKHNNSHAVQLDLLRREFRGLGGMDADYYNNKNELCFSPEQWCSFFGTDQPGLPNQCGFKREYGAKSYCAPEFTATTPDLVCFRPKKYCRDAFDCLEMEERGLFPEW